MEIESIEEMAEFPGLGNGGTVRGVYLATRREGYSFGPNPSANLVGREEERFDRMAAPPVDFCRSVVTRVGEEPAVWPNAVVLCVAVLCATKLSRAAV